MENINVLTFDIIGMPVGDFSKFALIIIMFSMGLNLSFYNFKNIFKHPKPVFIGLLGQIILLPLVGFILTYIFDLRFEIAVGLIIIACCPGAATSNFMTYLAKGDLALSVTLTAIAGILTVFTIPLIINLALEIYSAQGAILSLPVLETIWNIFTLTALPVFTGMIVRLTNPKLVNYFEKLLTPISFGALLIVMIMTGKEVWPNLNEMIQEALVPVLMLNFIMVGLGLLLGKVFKLSSNQISTLGIEVGFQNYILGIVIALGILGNADMSIPPIIYLFSMYLSATIIIIVSRINNKNNKDQINLH